jgi:alkylation response protein AidB-like acyl-CoA dehydrogenase
MNSIVKSATSVTDKIDWAEKAAGIVPQLASEAVANDESRMFVSKNYKLLGEHRFFSAGIPVELGGGGASYEEVCAMVREFAKFCGSTALSYAMHSHPVAVNVFKHCQGDDQATASLRKIAADELVIAGTGANDWLDSSGEMTRDENGYRVTARKHFVSGSPGAQIFVTSAVYEGENGREIMHFAIPFSSEGIAFHDNWNTLGMRATGSNDISLDRVFVPDDSIVVRRPAGKWHPMWNVIIPTAMPIIMSAYVGLADAAVELGLASAGKKPEYLSGAAGELINSHSSSTIVLEDMIRMNKNHGFSPSSENTSAVFVRKTLATNAVQQTVQIATELAGGPAFFKGHPLERISRDVRAAHFHPLPFRRQQQFTGRIGLGLNPVEN